MDQSKRGSSLQVPAIDAATAVQQEVEHWRLVAQHAEERLKLALDVGRLGTWDWNITEDRITRDSYHEELFGFRPGDLSRTYESFLACVHPEDRKAVQLEVARCRQAREPYQQQYRVVWPDGTVHWIEGRARFHCDQAGTVIRMIGVVQEITDRKLLEQHQARFQALFEGANDAVLIADNERRYVDANPAAAELLGVQREELAGRPIEEFVELRDVGGVWRDFQKAGAERGTCRIRRPDGTTRDVEYSAKADFAPGLHLSILRDITERIRSEEALACKAAELARSNDDLQQFSYIASHDLQEPLRSITSFSQMLRMRYESTLGNEGREFLEYIVSGAARMKGLLDSLLAYSRAMNDTAGFTPLPLESAVHLAVMNLHRLIEETEATLTIEALPTLEGDPIQLGQLFQNLIGNAMKYRKPLERPQIHISAQEENGTWLITVRDNGIGISPEYTERIFGVFKRLHGNEISGSGVGLAIAKRIVENHGGRIWVESAPGEGSSFKFILNA